MAKSSSEGVDLSERRWRLADGTSGTKVRRITRLDPHPSAQLVRVCVMSLKSRRYVCDLPGWYSMPVDPCCHACSMTSWYSGQYAAHMTVLSFGWSSSTCHSTSMPAGGITNARHALVPAPVEDAMPVARSPVAGQPAQDKLSLVPKATRQATIA